MRTGKPVTQSSGAILLNPISRPDWQLDNKDVILLEKIGQVSQIDLQWLWLHHILGVKLWTFNKK